MHRTTTATTTARDLIAAYQVADQAAKIAATRAALLPGRPSAYGLIADLVRTARDNYADWADAMGHNAIAAEVTALGRILRGFLRTLNDAELYDLTDQLGIPHARYVSARALRLVLNTAYADDHPKKVHIMSLAADRYAKAQRTATPLATVAVVLVIGNVPAALPAEQKRRYH